MVAATCFAELRAKHLYVRYFPGPKTGDWMRITIGTDEQMDKLLQNL
jgi:histidinol-phosphate aminotransferase